jgi:hypothetical protein
MRRGPHYNRSPRMSLPSSFPPLPTPPARACRRARAAAALLLGVLGAIMLATVRDYGMTGDEGVQHRYARRVLRWYTTLGQDRSAVAEEDISMYGGLFELLAEGAATLAPLDPYETRHIVNVLFALAAFAAALRMGFHLGGALAAVASFLFLALTPPFYGHAFNNPKDIPFAGTFAVAVCAILVVSDRSPRLAWRDVLTAGLAIGLAAGVRVAGIALFGFALALWMAIGWLAPAGATGSAAPSRMGGLARLGMAWVAVVVVGWAVMILFWPWAQLDPIRNPFRALRAFSRFWETMVVFFDGRYVPSGEVTRFYLPTWFALTLPETYLVAMVLGLAGLAMLLRRTRPWPARMRRRVLQVAWLAGVALLPVAWIVIRKTPLYDGLRHFLFVMPILAVLAGVAVTTYVRPRWPRLEAVAALVALAALGCLTAADMVALHPYQSVYFNRLVAGGLRTAVGKYDSDYWCLSYREGAEWLLRRYAGTACSEKVRVGGHSILLQTSYYLRKTEEGRRVFSPVSLDDAPHYALATTRFGDHLRTPGRLVHSVERQGATLLYLFEVKAPACRNVSE